MATRIQYFGGNPFFFDLGFDGDLTPVSLGSTEVVVNNTSTGATVTLAGTGMTFSPSGSPTGGTLSSISIAQSGRTVATITATPGVSLVAFDQALEADADGNQGPLSALFQGPLTFDAAAATDGMNLNFDFYSALSGPGTFLGSNAFDYIVGTAGNDLIVPANGDDDIIATDGNDTVDFSLTNVGNLNNAPAIVYSGLETPISVRIDGTANTGSVTSAVGTDTLLNIARVLDWYSAGFTLIGTDFNDSFDITGGDESWMAIRPGEGNDRITITPDSQDQIVRVDYTWNGQHEPSQGIIADLSIGLVSRDGFGGQDTITVANTLAFRALELRATDFADSILGSDLNERFILQGGNDTLDGGDGDQDMVRYDRGGSSSGITLDFQSGVVTGLWEETAFTHSVTSIEQVRGTGFGDTLRGADTDVADWLEGRDGNDLIEGRTGDDRLFGGEGNDTLDGGAGRDRLYGGDGNDLLRVGNVPASGEEFGDIISPGLGNDTIVGQASHMAAGAGIDLLYDQLGGIGGLTITANGNGTGTAVSGDGRVNDTFSFVDHIEGSNDADRITFNSFGSDYRGLVGSGGNDTLEGGTGTNDTAEYRWDEYAPGTTGVVVNMATRTVLDGYGATDTLINIDRVNGSNLDDTMTAGTDGVYFHGYDGNDRLVGGDGDDRLRGGDGADTIVGGAGDDRIDGGETAADLRDLVFGGAGNDTIDGGYGNDELRGDAGNDNIAGGFGADTVIGGTGNDTLTGSAFGDEIYGGDGMDFVNGGFGSDRVNGGAGADSFFHLGIADHGSDWIQDYSAAQGDVLVFGGAATADQFQINQANTASAGDAGTNEAFVIYKPTGQIIWALVDGMGEAAITLRAGGVETDLLA
ncbi:calcium-binding protein [Jannaschia sp. 2305UL9-9]|uniref:calcium-binding protein n=1 Tax=Jannaschia sp. 2305UL9-9 TaxID=3121638 RepID=UPI0035288C50